MSALSLRLPDSLHDQIKKLAAEGGISINPFVVSAIAEKTCAFFAANYLEERGGMSSKSKFMRALSKAVGNEPKAFDKF